MDGFVRKRLDEKFLSKLRTDKSKVAAAGSAMPHEVAEEV
jgi:hypothetical protein